MKQRITDMVEDAIVYNVILKLQDELGIESGDTDIFLEMAFDEAKEQMTNAVLNMIRFQCITNNLTDNDKWCEEHQDVFQD